MSLALDTNRRDLTVHIGTELSGVDLAGLSDDEIDGLKQLASERGVVFLREQSMTLDDQVRIGRRLGTLLPVAPTVPVIEGFPEVHRVYNDSDRKNADPGAMWHTDQSFWERPPAYSMLRIQTQPAVGGDTIFGSMYGVYESLSPALRRFLLTLTAFHSGAAKLSDYFGAQRPPEGMDAVHPVVRTHPATGRRALYVNRAYTQQIVELEPLESKALLDFLYNHIAYAVPQQVRFRWEPGSVALWDNRCVQHSACWDYYPEVREGFRVMTVGERPYLDAGGESR